MSKLTNVEINPKKILFIPVSWLVIIFFVCLLEKQHYFGNQHKTTKLQIKIKVCLHFWSKYNFFIWIHKSTKVNGPLYLSDYDEWLTISEICFHLLSCGDHTITLLQYLSICCLFQYIHGASVDYALSWSHRLSIRFHFESIFYVVASISTDLILFNKSSSEYLKFSNRIFHFHHVLEYLMRYGWINRLLLINCWWNCKQISKYWGDFEWNVRKVTRNGQFKWKIM